MACKYNSPGTAHWAHREHQQPQIQGEWLGSSASLGWGLACMEHGELSHCWKCANIVNTANIVELQSFVSKFCAPLSPFPSKNLSFSEICANTPWICAGVCSNMFSCRIKAKLPVVICSKKNKPWIVFRKEAKGCFAIEMWLLGLISLYRS